MNIHIRKQTFQGYMTWHDHMIIQSYCSGHEWTKLWNKLFFREDLLYPKWDQNCCFYPLISLNNFRGHCIYIIYYYAAIKVEFRTQRYQKKKSFLRCAYLRHTWNAMAYIHPLGFKSQWPMQQPQSYTLFPNAACSLNPPALDHRSEPPQNDRAKWWTGGKKDWNNAVTDTFSHRDPDISTSSALMLLRSQFCSRTSTASGAGKRNREKKEDVKMLLQCDDINIAWELAQKDTKMSIFVKCSPANVIILTRK